MRAAIHKARISYAETLGDFIVFSVLAGASLPPRDVSMYMRRAVFTRRNERSILYYLVDR
jgi:hypothetical protein